MYISALFWEFSLSYVQKIIDRGQVFVNGKKITKNLKIHSKDEFLIYIKTFSVWIQAEKIPLDIIYEDKNILLINKDFSINTHPTPWIEGKSGTLVNAILYHCKEKLPIISGEERPWIVHRLDKNTSWVIMIAKNDKTMKYLSEIIKQRKVKKYYIAIVSWIIKDKKITIKSYIGRHPTDRIRMTTIHPLNPKRALTHAEILWYVDDQYTILKVKLETGRTHQIRVHLASIGYPIIGDSVYGSIDINKKVEKKYWLKRQALHAEELTFELYGKNKTFIAEVKEDMKKIIDIAQKIL